MCSIFDKPFSRMRVEFSSPQSWDVLINKESLAEKYNNPKNTPHITVRLQNTFFDKLKTALNLQFIVERRHYGLATLAEILLEAV